jgi:hypothetical protein
VRRWTADLVVRGELDRRQGELETQIDQSHQKVLREVRAYLEHLEGEILRPPWGNMIGAPLRKLDDFSAAFLNYGLGERGFASQAGVWFRPPIQVAHTAGAVEVLSVTHKIVDIPFALRALSDLSPGSTVLDVGAAESPLALTLASLGYRVTAVDPRPYPLQHPNLTVVDITLEKWDGPARTFDAIVALSTLEYLGGGAYGEEPGPEDADLAAMRRLRKLAKPGCRLVLSVPFGRAGTGWRQRVYDPVALERLLKGWTVEASAVVVRAAEGYWKLAGPIGAAPETLGPAVALVSARL